MVITRTSGYLLWKQANALNLTTDSNKSQSTSFTYINPLPKARAKLTGQIQPSDRPCRHLVTCLDTVDRHSRIPSTVRQDHALVAQPIEFSLSIDTKDANDLLLTLEDSDDLQRHDRCKFALKLNILAD